jgi:hypothetical protein
MKDRDGNKCERHVCTLGGCRAWRRKWPDAKHFRIENGRQVEVPFTVCPRCQEHERECL